MNPSFILILVLTFCRLWIAFQLFQTARRSNLHNLYWLAGLFALAIYSLFTPTSASPLASYPIFHLGYIAGHACLAMFIHTTFYRNRRSPIYIVFGLVVLAFFVDIYALWVNDLNLAGAMTAVGLVNWVWHFLVARSAVEHIKDDPNVEDWVKARYNLMLIYIVLMVLATIQVVLSTTNFFFSLPASLLPVGLMIILASIILQFLVWVMPESFRKWLNRNQQARTAERAHEQVLTILDTLSTAMSDGTGLSKMLALFFIREIIAAKIQSKDSAAVEAHVVRMGFTDWQQLLKNPELQQLLKNSPATIRPNEIIFKAEAELIKKQSLFTMQFK